MCDIAQIITELCGLPGPAGYEGKVAGRVREIFDEYLDETRIDVMGNVIGVKKCGGSNAKKLLFDAHMDEIGLVVTGVQEGFLKVAGVGMNSKLLLSAEVMVLGETPVYGVVSALPPHVLGKDGGDKTVKTEELFIDIGMNSETAEKAIEIGTPVVYRGGARRFGTDGLCGKALDDRAGIAAIIRALELLKDERLNADLYVMASAQEEAGIRGAGPGAFGINPDFCVVVDVEFAKTPDIKPDEVKSELGGGVVITRGPNMNARFTEMTVNLARECGIKHQINVEPGGNSGTNAYAIQVSRGGVATALFGIPLKYMHSASEVVSIGDIECTAQLLCETAKRIKGDR